MKIVATTALLSGFAIGLSLLAPSVQAFEIQSATFIGQQTLPNNAPIAGNPPSNLNGLSGLTYAGNDLYYAITDNAPTGNARVHKLTIKIQGNTVQVTPGSTSYLKTNTGANISAQALDNEGIALTRDGKLWISSEGYITRNPVVNPAINQFSVTTGQQLTSLRSMLSSRRHLMRTVINSRGFNPIAALKD